MKPIQEPITGKENYSDLSQPYQALVQFYYAFNKGDLLTMSQNWHQSNDVAMDNPLGGIKRGWNEIKSVYEKIFNGSAEVYVEYYDYTIHDTNEMFYAVGRERGFFKIETDEIILAIRTSRIFKRVNGIWKQVHHHGSIEDPKLLERYQNAVFGKK
ncbi:MAG: nuclear transport factor 2 family protein [Ignavibacteriaceae bacterium]